MRRRKEGERIEGGERERRERLHCWQCDTWRKVMFQWLLWCQHTYKHTQHIDRRGPDRLLCAFVTCYYFGFGFGEQILFTCCRQGIHRAANTPAGFRSVMVRSWAGSRVQLFTPTLIEWLPRSGGPSASPCGNTSSSHFPHHCHCLCVQAKFSSTLNTFDCVLSESETRRSMPTLGLLCLSCSWSQDRFSLAFTPLAAKPKYSLYVCHSVIQAQSKQTSSISI